MPSCATTESTPRLTAERAVPLMIRIVRDLLSAFFLLAGALLLGSAVAAFRASAGSWPIYVVLGIACLVPAWLIARGPKDDLDLS
jgi:hypothetical protein